MKRLAPASCLLLLLFPLAVAAQGGDCNANGVSTTVKVYLAGFAGTDSITVADIIKSGKLEAAVKAFKITGFNWASGGNCLGGTMYHELHVTGDTLQPQDISAIKNLPPGAMIYFDCILAKNPGGKIYQLSPVSYKIRRQQ